MRQGVVILGHGSKLDETNNEIIQITKTLQEADKNRLYEIAFLSVGNPKMSQAVEILIKKGVEKIIIMPMFLFTGSHVQVDIPDILELQKKQYPNIKFIAAGHFGTHSGVADIIRERIEEAAGLL